VVSRVERHVAAIVFYLEIITSLVRGPFTGKLTQQRVEDILIDSHTGATERPLALISESEALRLAARPDRRPPEIPLVRSKFESGFGRGPLGGAAHAGFALTAAGVMSYDKAGRTEAVLIGAPGAGLRREGEFEPALLSRLDGGIGAVPTQLEVVWIG